MTALAALVLLCPSALAAGPRALPPLRAPLGSGGAWISGPISPPAASVPGLNGPGAAGVVRLVVEPGYDPKDRFTFMGKEQREAVEAAVAASNGAARVIRSDGASAIFEGRAFIEVQAGAADSVKAALEASGLRVSVLEEAVAAFHGAAAAGAPADDEALKAAAGAIMDGSKTFVERSAALGALTVLLESSPAALGGRSEQARREAAFALYNGLSPLLSAYNAVRGEQRQAARERWYAAHGNSVGNYVDMELDVHAELEDPALKAPVEDIRAVVPRIAAAIEVTGTRASAPLLLSILPHAEHALQELLASSPAKARALIAAWHKVLKDSVDETLALTEDWRTAPKERREEIRMHSRSGGISGLAQTRVSGHRAAMYAWDLKNWFFNLDQVRGSPWSLLGAASEKTAQALADGFLELLVDSEPKIKAYSDMLRDEEAEGAASQFESMAKGFREKYASDEKMMRQLDDSKAEHVKERLERYDEYSRVEGHYLLDGELQALSYFGPYARLQPGFEEALYLKRAAALLREAAALTGLSAFKLVAHTALALVDEAREWAWPRLLGDARDELEALEREVLARAAAEGLTIRPK